jgi:hypothetical protein
MRFFLKAALPSLFFGLFVLMGCSKDSGTNNTQTTSAVGTWSKSEQGVSASIVFRSDNTYTFTINAAGTEMSRESGTYTTSGSSVTMTPTSCNAVGMTVQCNGNTTSTISGTQMTVPNDDGTSMVLTKS